MKIGLIIVSLFLVFSCNQKENDKTIPVNSTDTIVTVKDKVADKVVNAQHRDTINMLVQDEKGSYSAFGIIDSIHPIIYVKFTNENPGNLHAVVTPVNGAGNIRFNQIFFPDKRADGPFGQEVTLELKQIGEHTLIIGHSLMAENPYSGKFKVEIRITTQDIGEQSEAN